MSNAAPLTCRSLFSQAVSIFRTSWRQLLFTALLYRAVAFVVLWPIAGLLLQVIIRTSGHDVLTEEDLPRLLLSPLGLTGAVVMGGLVITILALEQSCHVVVAYAAHRGKRLSALGALQISLRCAIPVLIEAVRILIWCLVVSVPFLAVAGVTYISLLTQHDINFYLSERPREFIIALVIAALLMFGSAAILLPKLISWCCALPVLLLEHVSPRNALDESTSRMRGHRGRAFLTLSIWGVAALILGSMTLSGVALLAAVVVPLVEHSLTMLVFCLGILVILLSVGNLIVSILQSTSLGVITTEIYCEVSSDLPEPVSGRDESTESATRWRGISQRWLLSGTIIAALVATGIGYILLNSVRLEEDVIVIAHRGAAGTAPENTLASVRQALTDGADVVEIDVQETADGEVVVIHDSDLMKIGGVDLKIWDATMEDLTTIDIGSHFDSRFQDERVPTLRQVLDECRDKAIVDIELKYYGHEQQLEQRVVDIVEEAEMEDQVILMSLKYAAVQKLKSMRPEWTVGLLTATAIGDLTKREADFLAVNTGIFSTRLVARAHDRNKPVYVWTVNDAVDVSRYASLGADGVITDFPARARQVLQQREAMAPVERALLDLAFFAGLSPGSSD